MGSQTKQNREERGQPSNVAGGEEDQPATFAHPAIYLRIAPVKIFRARDIGTGPRPISSSVATMGDKVGETASYSALPER